MEVASKGKLNFIQTLLIARKHRARNPLCGLGTGPAQLVCVDVTWEAQPGAH